MLSVGRTIAKNGEFNINFIDIKKEKNGKKVALVSLGIRELSGDLHSLRNGVNGTIQICRKNVFHKKKNW